MNGNHGTPIRFGLVGAGVVARAYVQALAETDQATLVGIADCRRDAATELAEAGGCASFDGLSEMAREIELDAVLCCTPPATHEDVCCEAIELGLHVLCEKPLAVDSAAAERMIDAATDRGVAFTMASKFRYVADVVQANVIARSGAIGELVLFENVFTGRVNMGSRWNSDPRIAGGGVLIDNGTHSVDVTRYFLGELVEVQAMEGRRIQDLAVEDTAKMFVTSRSGVLGSIDLSWSVSKELPYFIAIYGSGGTILVGWRESKFRRTGDADWIIFGKGYDKIAAFRGQIENFSRAVRGEEPLRVTPIDALASVQVIEAAYRSMARGGWEAIVDDLTAAAT